MSLTELLASPPFPDRFLISMISANCHGYKSADTVFKNFKNIVAFHPGYLSDGEHKALRGTLGTQGQLSLRDMSLRDDKILERGTQGNFHLGTGP